MTYKPSKLGDELTALVSPAASLSTTKMESFKDWKHVNKKGMNMFVTAMFIVGETAGGGLIALPTAFVSTGLPLGLVLLICAAIICAYTGLLLAENWNIMQYLWPEYQNHCRKPYPEMGLRAIGPKFGHFVSFILQVTQFGTAVVFLLLCSKNVENMLMTNVGMKVSFCYLILIVAVVVFPLTLPKSPKDFWYAIVAAMAMTFVAVCLIITGSVLDYGTCQKHAAYPPINILRLFMSFGTIMFAYGGHGAFPTIQHDMKKPYQFNKSASLAFFSILCLYIPVSSLGYTVYGSSLTDSIIPSIQNITIQTTINVLITLHVGLALTIVFNPLNQEFEEWMKVSESFGIQRILSRAFIMATVVFAAESVPNFGVLLDLVGGSTINLMALVLPVVFNMSLVTIKRKVEAKNVSIEAPITWRDIYETMPHWKFATNFTVLAIAVVGGIASTYSAMQSMFKSEFTAPCYASLWSDEIAVPPETFTHQRLIACCGAFRNVTSLLGSHIACSDPTTAHLLGGGHG